MSIWVMILFCLYVWQVALVYGLLVGGAFKYPREMYICFIPGFVIIKFFKIEMDRRLKK